jgi:hypothetical protein
LQRSPASIRQRSRRIDRQVKVNGHRVELDDLEENLRAIEYKGFPVLIFTFAKQFSFTRNWIEWCCLMR